MRASLLTATASFVVLALPAAAQSTADVAAPKVESATTTSCTFRGRVLSTDGTPAREAVVVTSAGGQAITGDDGRFALAVIAPRDALRVHVTAVKGSSAASKHVAWLSQPDIDVGTLALAASTSCEPDWIPTFGASGPMGGVTALAALDDGSGPALYLGGVFVNAGGVVANNIVKWTGSRWAALGSGVDGTVLGVRALAVFDDGNGPALYAGGDFTSAGGVPASHIAKWNGSSWSALGSGVGGAFAVVHTLAAFDDGSGPALYAGGTFVTAGGGAATRIAKWDGTTWSAIGSGMDGKVNVLAVLDDGSGPALYAGGEFATAGGVAASRIAKWDGASWTALGSGMGGGRPFVMSLTVFDDGSGAALYAGGEFTSAGGVAASKIARWNGASWSAVGGGITGAPTTYVTSLSVFDDGSGPALYASGTFSTAGSTPANDIAKWNGATWSALGSGMLGGNVLAVFDDGNGQELYAAGSFSSAGGVPVNNIAQWDGAAWSALGSGLSGQVNALAVFDDGSGPALHVAGWFASAGTAAASNIAKWDGAGWSALGNGVSGSFAKIWALTVFDDGNGAALYAGGSFSTAGTVAALNIAKWNGTTWSAVGTGFDGSVSDLAVFDDGNGATLYAGGSFANAGEVSARALAKWNGSAWAKVGLGIGGTSPSVNALEVFDDGSGAALYVGGSFTTAGGASAVRIARWDGSAWSALGTGMDLPVSALAVFDDGSGSALYAGGYFGNAGGVAASRIAKWDGASWSALGTGMSEGASPAVLALQVFDDGSGSALYAGGSFHKAGGTPASNIARWNGSAWSPLAGGIGFVYALLPFDDGSGSALAVGGWFPLAPSGDSNLAKWACSLPDGARTYGASSSGCSGALAIGVTSSPCVGNAAFGITCTSAPPSAPGAFFAGTALMAPIPILGIGIWVSPIVSLPIASDASGSASIAMPLPPDPMLAGLSFDVQLIWVGPTAPPPCPPLGLSASNALELTIQP